MLFQIRKLTIALIGLGVLLNSVIAIAEPSTKPNAGTHPYNIILIISDQENYHLPPARGYQLSARERLAKHGVSFRNHYSASAMCSASRAAFLTGTPPQVTGVFDQVEYSYVPNLNPKQPNMGSVLKKLGYRTAYFGKFEMEKKLFNDVKDTINYSTLARPYGFDTFSPDGDYFGSPLQGYFVDGYIAGEAVRWLRENALPHPGKQHKPFFLVVSLVNPHDIMFTNTNLPGKPAAQKPVIPALAPIPNNSLYKKQWDFSLPSTLQESLTAPGMPPALMEYQLGWSKALGEIPTDRKDMWAVFDNFYLNLIRDNDRSLQQVVDAIDELNLWENTVVINTSDHGEMAGAHGGLRGKGPFAYEDNMHIPLIIDHPKSLQGVSTDALTSHIDMLPTLVGLTGLPSSERQLVTKGLPGHDFSNLITNPVAITLHTVRPAILFNYVGISTVNAEFLVKSLISTSPNQPSAPVTDIKPGNRGFLAAIFDGRYKFGRFYAPNDFNTPKTFEELFLHNDVQLFDLKNDPNETKNLALEPEKNKELILQLNQLLNEMMEKEVGAHNNSNFLPKDIQKILRSKSNKSNGVQVTLR